MLMTQTSLYLGGKGAVELLPPRDRAVAAAASPLNRVGQPEDVAEAFAFLAANSGRWITGQNIAAGGGVF
jgi:3-oxoacyl-[acyl-carrier protein] reductase